MESLRMPYKNDAFGKPIYAQISWLGQSSSQPRPIGFICHGGGLVVGSANMIPKPQIEWLVNHSFVTVAVNYRLSPQVSARESFADCEEAYDWTVSTLPQLLLAQHGIKLDSANVVVYGHSIGGTMALHLGAVRPNIRAVTAFYPSLFISDLTTNAHAPYSAPPFGTMPDFEPTADDWASIKPADAQVSEAALALPGTVPAPRNRWQAHLIKHGQLNRTVCPDGDYSVIDPVSKLLSPRWPPVMIVQGDADDVPGSGLILAERAIKEIEAAGVKNVQLEVVAGERHMFDLPPTVGTSDVGPKWEAVVKGLEWLKHFALHA